MLGVVFVDEEANYKLSFIDNPQSRVERERNLLRLPTHSDIVDMGQAIWDTQQALAVRYKHFVLKKSGMQWKLPYSINWTMDQVLDPWTMEPKFIKSEFIGRYCRLELELVMYLLFDRN